MNSVTYDVTKLPSVLIVGRQTETGVMAVRLDCTGWLTFWPDLALRVFVTAPNGVAAYPAKTHMEGKVLVWDVSSVDTQTAGKGTLEVVGEAAGKRKCSAVVETNVLRTTTATTTEPPEEIKTWYDEVMEGVVGAEGSATRAAASAKEAKDALSDAETTLNSIPKDYLALNDDVAQSTERAAEIVAVMPDDMRGAEGLYVVTWENGAISNTNGTESASTTRIRSDYIPVGEGLEGAITDTSSDICYWVRVYDQDKLFVGYASLNSSGNIVAGSSAYAYPVMVDTVLNLYPNAGFIRLVAKVGSAGSATITPEENNLTFTKIYDDRLNGKMMDEVFVRENTVNLKLLDSMFADVSDAYGYKWETSGDGGVSWSDSSSTGADTRSVTLSVKAYMNGYQYRCKVLHNGEVVGRTPIAVLHVSGGKNVSTIQAVEQDGIFCVIGDTDFYAVAGVSYTLSASVKKLVGSTPAEAHAMYGDFVTLYETKDLDSVQSGAAFDLEASTADAIYALYDGIMATNPETITKNLLGYATASDGSPDESLPIYEYVVDSRSVANSDDSAFPELPTVLITSGTHAGTEKMVVWCVYQMVKAMFGEYDKSLSAIKSNVRIKIIPIVNPWAFNNVSRTNARGVNLNRNFGYNWSRGSDDSTSTEYRGGAAYSELETQIVKTWLEANADAILLIDYHNCFAANERTWACSIDRDSAKVYATYSRRMSDYLAARYSLDTEKNLCRLSASEAHAGPADECRLVGIARHVCLESNVNGFSGVKYDASATQLGVDVLVNYLLAILNRESRV